LPLQEAKALFYLFLLPLGSTSSAKLFLAVYALTGIAFFALRPLRLGNAVQTIRHFLQLQQSTSLSIMGESAILRRYLSQTAKAKTLVTASAICLILLCSILISSPTSWDSYTYNLARIAHVLIRRSPFITHSPSLPQAIFPLGHAIVQLLTSNHFAIADGYAFTLSRFRGEEFSLTSPLVQLTALLAIITLASCFFFQKKDIHSKANHYSSLRRVLDLQGVGLIVTSSVASSLLFSLFLRITTGM
jgi:hypothetical protein